MSKALITVAHYSPPFVSDFHMVNWEYFQRQLMLWGREIDTLYLVNSNGFFPEGFRITAPCNVKIINTTNFSHAQNLNAVFPEVTEDKLCIIDFDTIVYEKGIFTHYFNMLQEHDVVSYIERPSADKISRFAPYFFMANRSVFSGMEVDFSEAPQEGHLDPLAKLTHQLLDYGIIYHEVPDDRSTIQMLKDGTVVKNPEIPLHTGIYHARNFQGGRILLDEYMTDKESFERRFTPMPPEEVTRLFGWLWRLNFLTRKSETIESIMLKILQEKYEITPSVWYEFMMQFNQYHDYLKI